MKKWLNQIRCKGVCSKAANLLAMAMVIYTANATCLWAHHQPEVPEGIQQFRKF